MIIPSSFLSQLNDKQIKNELSTIIKVINEALEQGLSSIKPENVIKFHVKRNNDIIFINNVPISILKKRLYIVGAGKATFDLVKTLIPILGENYKSGIINIPKVQANIKENLLNTTIVKAGHPVPDKETFQGSQLQLDLLDSLTEQDIVFVIITGGASALFEVPEPTLSRKDVIEMYRQLVISGLPIQEINILRKHLSLIKGGKLIEKTKAQIIGLLISDVPGDDIASIGSGPTVKDYSTFQDCLKILQESNLLDRIPITIKKYFLDNLFSNKDESLKIINAIREPMNFLLCSNKNILETIQNKLVKNDINTTICSSTFSGEAQEIGSFLVNYIQFPYIGIPYCLLYGGESIVSIKPNKLNSESQGGRNQELILSFICDYVEKQSTSNVVIVSFGTDGIDGNSTYAGAFFSSKFNKIHFSKFDSLKYNLKIHNSANALPTDCYINTGPTGTNVGDILLILCY